MLFLFLTQLVSYLGLGILGFVIGALILLTAALGGV